MNVLRGAVQSLLLGSSSAFTDKTRTVYHFSCSAGIQSFLTLFKTMLDALLCPDFADEEIRREVCHMGVFKGALCPESKWSVAGRLIWLWSS